MTSDVVRYLRHAVRPSKAAARVAAALVVLSLAGSGMIAFLRSDFAQSRRPCAAAGAEKD